MVRPVIRHVWAHWWVFVVLAVACGSPSVVPAAQARPDLPTATAAPTASPEAALPSPTPAAPATPTPERSQTPEATPANPRVAELGARAMEFLADFTKDFSPRETATVEESNAADFLASRLESHGYQVRLQPFTFDDELAEVLIEPELREPESLPLSLSGQGSATGPLVSVGKAMEDDVPPGGGLAGKVALIERGVIQFEEKVRRVTDAGAAAAVIYNNRRGLFRGSLATEAPIPVVALTQDAGRELRERLEEGDVEAAVSVAFEQRDSQNVVADKPGTAGDGSVVVLGGHYDTVADVPGANDNGAGIATLLTIAAEVAGRSYPFTVRFIPFGAEERGLLGSGAYVDSLSEADRQATVMMLNFDALASGDVVGLLGNFELIGAAVDFGRANGVDVERRFSMEAGTSSDHAQFDEAGIPVVFFLADDFSRIHTPEDTLEFIDPELMGASAVLALHLLESAAGR